MSSVEDIEAKTGHAPAMKVGGVRVPTRRRSTDDKETERPHRDSEGDDRDEEVVVKSAPKPPVVISGTVARVDKDFPTAGVKHTHEKPVPTHDVRPGATSKPMVIQQPRK